LHPALLVVGDGVTIRFPRKRIPSFSTTRVIRTWIREVGELEVQKKIEIHGVLKKEMGSTRCTSYQADRHGYLLEVKIEIPEQMPDRINNSSARSAIIEKLGPNQ
jgi:hypothetical protein